MGWFDRFRFRRRGIDRSGDKYVVEFTDEFGREQRREFDTLARAREFKTALEVADEERGVEHTELHRGTNIGSGGDPTGALDQARSDGTH